MDDQWNQNPGGQAPADPNAGGQAPAADPNVGQGAGGGVWTPPADPGVTPAPEPSVPPVDPNPAPVDPNAGQPASGDQGTGTGGAV